MDDIKHFTLPGRPDERAHVRQIAKLTGAEVGEPETHDTVYLDTFDWRIHAAGGVLEAEKAGNRWHLTWLSLAEGRPLGRLAAGHRPAFPQDMAPSPARARLAKVTDIRALLARVQVRLHRQPMACLNGDRKTVVRLDLVEGTAIDPETGEEATLPPRVTVTPMRGYAKPYDKVLSKLTKAFGVPGESGPLMLSALAAIGRTPGDYQSKIRLQIPRGTPADSALKDVCHTLLRGMERNYEGVLADTDTEFLHDFRVAVRRTRTALSQAKGVFPEAVRRRFADDFKWLGRLTSDKRDLDVFRLDIPAYRDQLPADQRPAMQPFQDFLDRRADAALAELSKAMRSDSYRRLVTDWRDFLDSPMPEVDAPDKADTPIEQVAALRIEKAHAAVIADGRKITADCPPEALHDLRKRCKKLRYLLEFFRSLFKAEDVQATVKALKRLQSVLGTYQDSAVQREALMAFGREMDAEGNTPPETLMALGTLTATLEERQATSRAAFAERFNAFDSKTVRKRLDAMLAKDLKKARA